MSKIKAPKERVSRVVPRHENTLVPASDTPSMMPPFYALTAESKAVQDQTHEGPNDHPQNEGPETQVLARGPIVAADIPRLPVGGGEALKGEVLAAYEEALGINLSAVRIHTSAEAQNAVLALGAEALTHQNDIYLSKTFQPGDPESERALAHELLHVRQFQAGQIPSAKDGALSSPHDPLEIQAYSQENEITKAALAARGEATDAPILNQDHTPLTNQEPTNEAGGDASAEFEAMDAEMGPELSREEQVDEMVDRELQEKAALETTGQGDAPAAEGEGADAAAPSREETAENAVADPAPAAELPVADAQSSGGNPVVAAPAADVAQGEAIETYKSKATADHEGEKIAVADESAKVKQLATEKATALRSTGAVNLASYQQSIAAAKARLQQKAASAKQSIQAGYAAQIQTLTGTAGAQIAAVVAAAAAQKAALQAFAASEIQRYTAGKTTELAAATASVEAKKAATLAAANAAAERARTESAAQAQSLLSMAGGFPMGGEADANEAKRKAVNDIAQDAAGKIRANGDKVASGVLADATSGNAKYDEALATFTQSLEEKAAEYIQNATELGTSVAGSIDQAASQAQSAIEAALSQGVQALQTASTDACAQVDRQLQQNISQLTAAETQVSAGFQKEVDLAATRVTTYGDTCSSQLLKADGNDVAGVQAAVQSMETNINSFYDELNGGFGTWLSQSQAEITTVEQSGASAMDQTQSAELASATTIGTGINTEIVNAGAAATQGMTTLVTETQQNITQSTDEMIGAMADSRADLDAKLEEILQDATKKFDEYVTKGLAAGQKLVSDASGKMQEAVAEIDSQYSSMKSEAEAKNSQVSQRVMRGFWSWVGGIVDSVVTWFKEKFFDWLKGFVIGVLKALVIVLIVAVILFFAPELAIILLIGGVCMAIYSRWQEYKLDHNGEGPGFWWGVGCVVLGVLDITGIPYIIEGFAGQRATGGVMTTEESGERQGMGLVFLITLGLAGYKKFGGRSTRVPVEDPLRLPVEEPIREPVEPVREPVEPVREPVEPVREPVEPVREPVEPVREPVEPVREPVEPVREPVEPVREPVEPVREPVEPVREPVEPVREPVEPVREPVEDPNRVGVSPETQAAFKSFLGNKKFKLNAKDIEAIVTQVSKRPGGERLMTRIMDGNFAEMEGFGKVLSGLKQSMKVDPDLVAKTEQTLDAADALRNAGHENVYFERATDQYGYDADVGGEPRASVSPGGRGPVVVQLKYVQNLKGIASNVTKGCSQLVKAPEGTARVVEVIVKDGTLEQFNARGQSQGIESIHAQYPNTEIRIIFSDGQILIFR